MLPATVFLWLSLEIFGFALIYWAGLRSGGMTSSHGAGRGLGGALYMSAGDISTLTFGDVIATSGFWRAAVDVQAMLGLGTFTLALGYLVTTYGVLANLDSLHSTVRRNAAEPVRPSSILVRHYRGGEPVSCRTCSSRSPRSWRVTTRGCAATPWCTTSTPGERSGPSHGSSGPSESC
jgi:hypothetical protein